MEVIKDLVKLIKANIIQAIAYIKVYRLNLFVSLAMPFLFLFQMLLSVYIIYKTGILEILGVSLKEALLFIAVAESVIFLKSIVVFKSSIANQVDSGEIVKYLIRPIDPMIYNSFYLPHVFSLIDFMFLFLPLPLILIFLFKIPFKNLVIGYFHYLAYLFFTASFYVFIRSLDLLVRRLTYFYFSVFEWEFSNVASKYTPAFLKYYKWLFYVVYFLTDLVAAFFLVVPAFLYGKTNWELLILTITASVSFWVLARLIWKKGLRKVEIYN